DYKDKQPGTRLFQLYINDKPMDEAGRHGRDGFYWELVGNVTLEQGQAVMRIHDSRSNFARADAFFLTSDAKFNPNTEQIIALRKYKIYPEKAVTQSVSQGKNFEPVSIPTGAKEIALIQNEFVRMRILESSKGNAINLTQKIEVKSKNSWKSLDARTEDCQLFLLKSSDPGVSFSSFYPSWRGTSAVNSFVVKGKTYQTADAVGAQNPFLAGAIFLSRIVKVNKTTDETLEVTYRLDNAEEITSEWRLKQNERHLHVRFNYKVPESAFYSFSLSAFQGIEKSKVANVQLPPMYQYQRVPEKQNLIPLALTPMPVSIVETKLQGKPFSFFITPDPDNLSGKWGAYDVGFSLKNYDNLVQPVAFAPVLGLEGSKVEKNKTLQKSFKIGMLEGGWETSLEYVSDHIYEVRDYRRQTTSLTTSVFNQIDLMKNDEFSGWNNDFKGFYDIEADPKLALKVVNPSPLAVLSAAILTRDEDLYIKRSLPVIEYTLSRRGYRWGVNTDPKSAINPAFKEFGPYNTQFNTAYFDGLSRLLGGKNPWIKKLALPNGKPRYSKGYGTDETWTGDLAAYRLTKDKGWLTSAIDKADKFIDKQIYGQKTGILGIVPFYNVSNYPAWFDLLDLYDVHQKQKYLDASDYAAHFTLAGIRSYPKVKNKPMTIHPNNEYKGNADVWWKGTERYKMGYPRQKGDVKEKEVPDYVVSPVGLGLEQPMTFFTGGEGLNHVYMSSWAPSLLRLNTAGKRPIFEAYARNGVIGRFSNYPGYYAAGYTDLPSDSIYPYQGPDITSIYYHHIQSHLALTLDFLVTEAIQRSKGTVNFPYGKQQGFVWFNNRIYGGEPGTILSDKNAHIFLRKNLIAFDNEQVNYLSAQSDLNFYIIVLNESDSFKKTKLKLGKEVADRVRLDPTLFKQGDVKGEKLQLQGDGFDLDLPGKGISILRFPLKEKVVKVDESLVQNGFEEIELKELGCRLYVFRIRSPFGWDSFYGYLTKPLAVRAKANLQIGGVENAGALKSAFPYEWSTYKINPDDSISYTLTVVKEDGEKLEYKGVL
ncbi:MAG: hypothetical protein QM594_04975, partial [Niabella sp.]